MLDERADEFYIGYLPASPPRHARHTRLVVVVHVVLSMAAATLIVAGMRDPGPGVWEDGTPRTCTGTLCKDPYPALLVDGHAVLLVDFGKRGAQARFAAIAEGSEVTVSGYPIRRDGRDIVELEPSATAVTVGAGDAPGRTPGKAQVVWTGERATLAGEIVDTKCFLGAMKPGEGKTHKACAIRCISGGIPAGLVTWDGNGTVTYYLLADARGGPPGAWLHELVGEGVEVRGELGRLGDLPVLRVAPGDIRGR
jgi:hypothetical protein